MLTSIHELAQKSEEDRRRILSSSIGVEVQSASLAALRKQVQIDLAILRDWELDNQVLDPDCRVRFPQLATLIRESPSFSYFVNANLAFGVRFLGSRLEDIEVFPSRVTLGPGQRQRFKAFVRNEPGAEVHWTIAPGGGGSVKEGKFKAPEVL